MWVFYDVPHLLKLVRNNFLDSGFKLTDGTVINKTAIEQLIEKDSGELKTRFQLTHSHITVSCQGRQNVRSAAQLFSTRTAKALKYALKNDKMAEFLLVINDAFDVLNSRIPYDEKNKMKSSFGDERFQWQNEILEKMKKLMYTMRVGNNKNLLPFQRGFIISIESLRGLYRDFMKKHHGRYLLTSRLNQDCLENFFFRIRRLGGFYDHPQATEVRNRIQLLILSSGKVETIISPHSSVATDAASNGSTSQSVHGESTVDADDDLTFLPYSLFIRIEEDNQECQNVSNDTTNLPEDSLMDDTAVNCGKDALNYIAGYIAFQCATGHFGVIDQEQAEWIHVLSRDGLRVPSLHWLDSIKQFQIIFAGKLII